MNRVKLAGISCIFLSMATLSARATDEPFAKLAGDPACARGLQWIEKSAAWSTEQQIRLTEIPAPEFNETRRGQALAEIFAANGFQVLTDKIGNVIAERPGSDPKSVVLLAAHLDTVFPAGTDVRVKRDGARLLAPGIADNGVGLASLAGLAHAIEESRIRTTKTIVLAGDVGEEGEGNLRGARHLFTKGEFSSGLDAFISLDGPGVERITHRALGSRRYRVTISGPGGHSWGDFGTVNPVHALGRAIARFAAYPAPLSPRTSYNVGIVEGGSSVNAIPQSATMTVDLRSVNSEEIAKLEAYLRRVVELAVREENSQRALSGTRLSYETQQVGDRPSGETPVESRLVQTSIACSRVLGIETRLDCSSTDSNIPISVGIPAITIGAGGVSGNCHSLSEWYEPTGRALGLKRLLLLVGALAGLPESIG